LHPDINTSEVSFSVEKVGNEKFIRVGLSGVKHVGEESLKIILEGRPYKSYQDFVNKVDLSKVNKRVCHSLISVGCFDSLGIPRNSLLTVYDKIEKESNSKEKQMTLFGGAAKRVNIPELPPMSMKEKLDLESSILGVCVSGHYIDAFSEGAMSNFIQVKDLHDGVDGEVFGIVKRYSRITTKNGEDMAFIDLEDKSGELKVIIFPKDFENCVARQNLKEGYGVRIFGRYVASEEFGNAFIAKEISVCSPF